MEIKRAVVEAEELRPFLCSVVGNTGQKNLKGRLA